MADYKYYSNIEILDLVLNYMHEVAGADNHGISEREVADMLKNKYGIDTSHSGIIIEKLIKDSYVRIDSPFNNQISFNGKIFQEEGGYGTLERERKAQLKKIELDNTQSKNNERRLRNATWTTAAGAFSLVVWEMIKTFCLHLK